MRNLQKLAAEVINFFRPVDSHLQDWVAVPMNLIEILSAFAVIKTITDSKLYRPRRSTYEEISVAFG
uniref:Uncharacterized protein n=1 Tax=Oryza punctata TaxID=4537 RepID=A0A0E0L907_ORYPU